MERLSSPGRLVGVVVLDVQTIHLPGTDQEMSRRRELFSVTNATTQLFLSVAVAFCACEVETTTKRRQKQHLVARMARTN